MTKEKLKEIIVSNQQFILNQIKSRVKSFSLTIGMILVILKYERR